MKTMRLAALLPTLVTASLALAGPAWAFNEDTKAFDDCVASGASTHICMMQNVGETEAREIALNRIKVCATVPAPSRCPQELPYTKARWGY